MTSRLEPLRGEIERALRGGENVKSLAVRLGVARSTLRDYIRVHKLGEEIPELSESDLVIKEVVVRYGPRS